MLGEPRRVAERVGQGSALVGSHVGDDDGRPLGHERLADAGALTHRTAGDDRDLAVQPPHQTVSPITESAAKPTEGSRSAKNPPSWASRSEAVHDDPTASNRCSTTGAATTATIPP